MKECDSFRKYLDSRKIGNDLEIDLMTDHFSKCEECSRELELERMLRGIITPEVVPEPSNTFEADLLAKLDLHPAHSLRHNFFTSFSHLWGLTIVTLMIGTTILTNLSNSTDVIRKLGMLLYAGFLSMLNGQVGILLGDSLRDVQLVDGINNLLVASVVFASLILISSFLAVNLSKK